ncbi:MAG: YaiI/YqxD family protein [Syntrophomonas sp.]|nr:YaiI/YqxD family protein [Syntrophomonas sp.]
MKILVDADACPVKQIIESTARRHRLEVIMISNPNHQIQSQYASVVVVDGASQAADMAIVNRVTPGDIVVTQDYGLACMAIAKGGLAVDNSGQVFTAESIDGLLLSRFLHQKARRAGERTKGPRRRIKPDDSHFARSLEQLIAENID